MPLHGAATAAPAAGAEDAGGAAAAVGCDAEKGRAAEEESIESTASGSPRSGSSGQSAEAAGVEAGREQQRRAAACEALRGAGHACADWLYPLARRGAAPSGDEPRMEALGAMRWLASIQSVLHNQYSDEEGFGQYAVWGSVWLQLFVLAQGFVLAYRELSGPPRTGSERPSTLRYVRQNLTAIYPTFLVSLLLKVTYAPGRTAFEWAMLPLQALLMHAWLPICHTTEQGDVLCSPELFNTGTWFVSTVLSFWFFVRPLAELFRRRSLRFSVATLLFCWLFSMVFQLLGSQDRLAGWLGFEGPLWPTVISVAIRSTPLGFAHVFVAGVATARVFLLTAVRDAETGGDIAEGTQRVALAAERAPLVLRFGCCVGYLAYAVLLFAATNLFQPYHCLFNNGGMLPIMVLILLGAAIGTDPITTWIFRSKPMLVLGRISFVQFLMSNVFCGWLRQTFGWDGNAIVKAILLPCLVLFSYCCQRWVERPYTEYQRSRREEGIKGFEDRGIAWLESHRRKVLP